MKVFPHGSNVNFQTSTREMFDSHLEQLLQRYMEGKQILFGTIDVNNDELRIYGTATSVRINNENKECEFQYQLNDDSHQSGQISVSFDELLISHEASFDLLDEDHGTVPYKVIYVTFENPETGEETTYFFADEKGVSQPLSCVVEFWSQVSEVGRDVNFELTGCTANEFSRLLKQKKNSCCND
ncbi:hypothetical protein [Hazenella coriacea]|uniref:Uncharacterized protein n=1 Tax=Hazenella coriacea TaxID=1179467 RepID=A0A4R3L696_9BACL|nr:hypothetical protein [Hazenella coriacea]TCS94942.1 hypothetical protein EDD58_103367 [Hazenella coriacea]